MHFRLQSPKRSLHLVYRLTVIFVAALLTPITVKGLYLFGGEPSASLTGLLDELFLAMVAGWMYFWASGLKKPWAQRFSMAAVATVALGIASTYGLIIAAYRVLGSFPRLQQLNGLTWKTVSPSIWPMFLKHQVQIVLVVLGGAFAIWAVGRFPVRTKPLGTRGYRAIGILTLLTGLTELFSFTPLGRTHIQERLLLARSLSSDLESLETTPAALAQEKAFFEKHDRKLHSATGVAPQYEDFTRATRGSNIILLSLESVRAADLSVHGGGARMPFLDSIRDQLIVVDRLYSQDVRSTKTFAAFELGAYEFPSWASYSNDLTQHFPNDSLARKLKALGYTTHALVNGDPHYDHNAAFHAARGYDHVLYQPDLNPGSTNSDDLKLLDHVDRLLAQTESPHYFLLWPFATHHPYGREYWADIEGWLERHPEGIQHKGSSDLVRYLKALLDVDDFLRRLVDVLKQRGVYDNTVIFLVGDHGEAFGEHEPGNVFHGNNLYEESVRVAAMVHSPRLSEGLVESRYFMTKDIPASILNLAGGKPYLGSGRSLFQTYTHELPVYLSNTFSHHSAIIHNGAKLRIFDPQPTQRWFSTMDEIARTGGAAEATPATDVGAVATHAALLDEWRSAMATRARRLLSQGYTANTGTVVKDTFRLFCDTGQGFSEANKGTAPYVGRSAEEVTLVFHLNRPCKALRLAPIEQYEPPKGERLALRLGHLSVISAGRTLPIPPLTQLIGFDRTSESDFMFVSSGHCLDFELASTNIPVDKVEIAFTLTGSRPR